MTVEIPYQPRHKELRGDIGYRNSMRAEAVAVAIARGVGETTEREFQPWVKDHSPCQPTTWHSDLLLLPLIDSTQLEATGQRSQLMHIYGLRQGRRK